MENTDQKIIAEKLFRMIEESKESREGSIAFSNQMELIRTLSVNTFNRPIVSKKPLIGPIIVFVKKVIRRMVAWYTNPFAEQQTDLNHMIANCLEYQNRKLAQLEQDNTVLQAELLRLEKRLVNQEQLYRGDI